MRPPEELLRTTPISSRLAVGDRKAIAEVATVKQFPRGAAIFEQESPSDAFYATARLAPPKVCPFHGHTYGLGRSG